MKRTKIQERGEHRYAIGPDGEYEDLIEDSYSTLAKALFQTGRKGDFLWQLGPDSRARCIRFWNESLPENVGWDTMENYEEPKDRDEDAFEDLVSNEVERAHFEEGLRIDKHALDDAFVEQPDLLRQVGDKHALALSIRDANKDRVKQVEADLYAEIRKQHERKDKKPTEAQLNAEVTAHPRRKAAVERYIQSVEQAARWEALYESYRARGYALGELSKLFLASYFSRNYAEGGAKGAEYRSNSEKIKQAYRERNK